MSPKKTRIFYSMQILFGILIITSMTMILHPIPNRSPIFFEYIGAVSIVLFFVFSLINFTTELNQNAA